MDSIQKTRVLEMKDKYSLALQAANVGVLDWEFALEQVDLSPIARGQFGISQTDKIDYEQFFSCIHPNDRVRLQEVVSQSATDRKNYEIEFRVVWSDGSIHWLIARGRAMSEDGIAPHFIAVTSEISRRKEAEWHLLQSREELAQQKADLERTVAERTEELQESVRSLEQLCYTIAHDLRAPLRALNGFMQAIVEDFQLQLDDTGRDFAQRAKSAAVRMDKLISDLLEFGRMANRDLPREMIDLNGAIDGILRAQREEIEQRSAKIEVNGPLPRVYANGPVLTQVITNLISNGLKFVPKGITPQIRIRGERTGSNLERLWIQDNGIGIASENQCKLFGLFERLNNSAAYPGSGVGLAIVKKGIERMGGQVGVCSELGKGSRFWIELPCAETEKSGDTEFTPKVVIRRRNNEFEYAH